MFKNDDEEFEYIDELDNDHANEFSRAQHSGSKEIDARIAYHYPTGNFRFPLIPDDHERQQRRERVRRQTEKNPEKTEIAFDRPIQPERKEKIILDRNKQEVAIKNRQPFRPTEIPSPIYGYGRRSQSRSKEEIVEFELTGLEGINDNKTLYDPNLKETNSDVPNFSAKSMSEETILIDDTYTAPEEKHESSEQSTNPNDSQTETTLINESNCDDEIVLSDSSEILQSSDAAEAEKEAASGLINHSREEVIETEQPIAAAVQNKESTVQEMPRESPERATMPEKRRSHIPFNVIMLKNDKRKLEQREMAKREQEKKEQKERTGNYVQSFTQKSREIEHHQIQQQEKIRAIEPDQEGTYEFPSVSLLTPPVARESNTGWLLEQEQLLNQTLENFNVGAKVVNVTQGPSVTRFEVQPDPGVKVNKITNLSDDIKLSLAARDIRIEAPIPGKHTIGIEVPNKTSRPVLISELIQSREFLENDSPLTAVLGLDISGKPIVTDLKKMPHGLIAGATGSGKSVCINSILISLLYKAKPEDVKLLLIDPKMVELAPYNHIPHLVSPVITNVKAATAALKWAVEEMERRYELFAHTGVRDIHRFNELAIEHKRYSDKLPYIVIVIDELADLMMMSPADVEEAIARIAQKARACGIHLIIATQRPSVDVITGLIKANVPTRIAFSVSSQIDSRTIIDISGAEKLLGRGDMLFLENGSSKPVRLQGTFVSDMEIDAVVAHVREQQKPQYLFEQGELLKKAQVDEEEDELFYEACEFVIEQGTASTSSLQRRFKIGYNRAARLIDMMEQQGFISEARGSKPRDVLITASDLESIQDTSTII
jgi:DNA segregation ATPase FtsK/SpoIIIE, S-DNA-T family